MSVTVTYNGYSLPIQLGKIAFSRGDRQASFSADFAVVPSGVEAAISALRVWDKTLAISAGGWSVTLTQNDSSGGAVPYVSCRPVVSKSGSVLDSSGRKRLSFTAIFELQTSDADGFAEYACNCEEDPQGRKVVTTEGIVTGTGATTAKANFDAEIDAIHAAFESLFGGTFEAAATSILGLDRYNGRLGFRRQSIELLETVNKYDGSEGRDTAILFTNWNISRAWVLERGNNDPHVKLFNVRWGATLAQGKTGIISQHDSELRALVVSRLRSQFGETSKLVLLSDEISHSSTEQSASSTWTVRVAAGDTILYAEKVSVSTMFATYEKNMDGHDLSIEAFSAGTVCELVQEVTHKTQDSPAPFPPPPALGGTFGPGAHLVLLDSTVDFAETNVGRSSGGSGYTTEEAVDYTMVARMHFAVRIKPSSSPIQRYVSGAKGKPSQGVYT